MVDRTVGPYIAAKLLSSIGVWIYNVVAAVVVFQATGSVMLVGAVSIAQFTPQVLIAPVMGAAADRGDRRRLVVVGRLTAFAGAALAAVAIAVGGADDAAAAWALIGTALLVGIGFAVSLPALTALVPAMVPPDELSAVIALDTLPFSIARAVGPALGGVLMVSAGPATAFAVAAASHLLIVAVVVRLPLRPLQRRPSADAGVRAGARYLRGDVGTAALLLAVAGVGFGVDPVITLTPPLAADFGAGEELVAVMASAFGAGAAAAAALVGPARRWLGEGAMGVAGLGILAVTTVALAASATPELAVGSLFLGGMGMMAAVTSLTTQIQRRVPEDLRGRMMAAWAVCFVGSRPLAAAINGFVADRWSPRVALLVIAVLLMAAAAVARTAARVTARPAPASAAAATQERVR